MLGKLLLAFVVLPLVDMFLLVYVASYIGLLETVALVVVTGVVGGFLARLQGLNTLRRIQIRVAKGESPSDDLFDGALILVGGVLLVTPGLITDGLGLLLLVPFTRPLFRRLLRSYLGGRVRTVRYGFGDEGADDVAADADGVSGGVDDGSPFDDGDAVDVEWEDR